MRFIDKPDASSWPVGIWGVSVAEPQTKPVFVSERLEWSTAGPDYLVETNGDTTIIERLTDGAAMDRAGPGPGGVEFSPDCTRIAWSIYRRRSGLRNHSSR